MQMIKTLHEVCDTVGVTRRAVQGYEKRGLVSPTKRNKYGHLLYDDVAQERINLIKKYQKLGFKLKEIEGLLDAPNYVVKEALKKQVIKLQIEKKEIIDMAYKWIEEISDEESEVIVNE